MINRGKSIMKIGVMIISLSLIAIGCGDNPTVISYSYSDMINSYIVDSEVGKALFSPQVYSEGFFIFGDSNQPHAFRFDSVKRSINIVIGTNRKDIASYEDIYDALATVTDSYFGALVRAAEADTIPVYKFESVIKRYGYFIKALGDSYPYRGWIFWGFVGGRYNPSVGPGNRLIKAASGITIEATPPTDNPPDPRSRMTSGYYINFDDIKTVPLGDSFTYQSNEPDILFVEDSKGIRTPVNLTQAGASYKTGWRTPEDSDTLYHIVTIIRPGEFIVDTIGQAVESTLFKEDDYVIPYRFDL
jgi:hypothetical protein